MFAVKRGLLDTPNTGSPTGNLKAMTADPRPAAHSWSKLISLLGVFIVSLVGCSPTPAESPLERDRTAADELPRSAESFDADPDTTRRLASHDEFTFYAAEALPDRQQRGHTCILALDGDEETVVEGCGDGPTIELGAPGLQIRYYVEGRLDQDPGWVELTPNLFVKEPN